MPCPAGFVVKNGSKRRACVAASMPIPCRSTERTTQGPTGDARRRTCRERLPPGSSAVRIVRRPPCGIASRAFTTRLRSTCSSWPASTQTTAGPAASSMTSVTSSPIRRRSIFSTPGHDLVQVEHLRAGATCRRLNARSWRVSASAAWPALTICSICAASGVLGAELVRDHLPVAEDHAQQVVEVVGDAARELPDGLELLRLEEAAPRPCSRRASSALRSVRSSLTATKCVIAPWASVTGATEARSVKCVPSLRRLTSSPLPDPARGIVRHSSAYTASGVIPDLRIRGFCPRTSATGVAGDLAEVRVHVLDPPSEIGDDDRDGALLDRADEGARGLLARPARPWHRARGPGTTDPRPRPRRGSCSPRRGQREPSARRCVSSESIPLACPDAPAPRRGRCGCRGRAGSSSRRPTSDAEGQP